MIFLTFLLIIPAIFAAIPDKYKGLYGSSLRNALLEDFGSHHDLGYKPIRQELYGYCFNKEGRDSVSAWYSNEMLDFKYGSLDLQQNKLINAEHIVPQAHFKEKAPMVSDGHHIRPCSVITNSARANLQFMEIEQKDCTYFYKDGKEFTSVTGNVNEYSCVRNKYGFYPRSAIRGPTARAVGYFFTIYPEYLTAFPKVIDADLMVKWNNEYAPDSVEIDGNECIKLAQGNANPYILYPELMTIAYCDKTDEGCGSYV